MTQITRHYEGMFLISQQVAANFADAIQHIRETMENAARPSSP